MAYFNSAMKKDKQREVNEVAKKHGLKIKLMLDGRTGVVAYVDEGTIDFVAEFQPQYNNLEADVNKRKELFERSISTDSIMVNRNFMKGEFEGRGVNALLELFDVMNKGNHNGIAYYVDVQLSVRNKGYTL